MESSREVIKQVEAWQMELLSKYGSRIVFIADEFYIMAGLEIPDYCVYEDFPQIENGVGLVAMLKKNLMITLKNLSSSSK